jgi:L-threonylcarbamoyladenylate synthase
VALALLEAFEKAGGKGVAAPSANRFGHVSPTTAAAVVVELGELLSNDDLVLDGGVCSVGVESTIIDCTGSLPRVLRPGAISTAMIEKLTGLNTLRVHGVDAIRVSGSLESHYAPSARVVLNGVPMEGQGFIAMAEVATPIGVVRLAAPKTHEEFAHVLYAALAAADEMKLNTIVVEQPEGGGIAIAVRDRLKRASTNKKL